MQKTCTGKRGKLFRWKRDVLPALLIIQAFFVLKWLTDCVMMCLSYFSADILNADQITFETDFIAYFTAAKIYMEKLGGIYDVSIYKAIQQSVFHSLESFQHTYLREGLPYLNPPHGLLVLLPFCLFAFPLSYMLWMLFNALMSMILIAGYISYFNIRSAAEKWLATLLLIGNSYWHAAVINGQFTLVLSAALVFFLWATKKDKPWLAALCLAVLAIKPNLFYMLAFPLLFSLPKRFLFSALVVGSGTVALSCLLFSPEIFQQYFQTLMKANYAPEGYAAGFEDMHNMRKVLHSYLGISFAGSIRIALAVLALASVALAALWAYFRPSPDSRLFETLLALTVSVNVFLSPWLHVHDLLILFVPAGILMRQMPWQKTAPVVFATLLYFVFINFFIYIGLILLQLMIIAGLTWQSIRQLRTMHQSEEA